MLSNDLGPCFAPLGFRLLLVAAAIGLGRPGMWRCRQGGLDCWQALVSGGVGTPAGRIFLGGWIFGNDDNLRLLLADNYIRTNYEPNHRGAEAQRLFGRAEVSLQPTDPCGPPAAAPRQPIARIASFLRAGLWPPPAVRAVWDCSDVVRAGGIAW
ncbi:MAG: hypothetical protein PHS80_02960 [Methanothrix sp.]|nr:hypothetical protein [Methanothrix sp.]